MDLNYYHKYKKYKRKYLQTKMQKGGFRQNNVVYIRYPSGNVFFYPFGSLKEHFKREIYYDGEQRYFREPYTNTYIRVNNLRVTNLLDPLIEKNYIEEPIKIRIVGEGELKRIRKSNREMEVKVHNIVRDDTIIPFLR